MAKPSLFETTIAFEPKKVTFRVPLIIFVFAQDDCYKNTKKQQNTYQPTFIRFIFSDANTRKAKILFPLAEIKWTPSLHQYYLRFDWIRVYQKYLTYFMHHKRNSTFWKISLRFCAKKYEEKHAEFSEELLIHHVNCVRFSTGCTRSTEYENVSSQESFRLGCDASGQSTRDRCSKALKNVRKIDGSENAQLIQNACWISDKWTCVVTELFLLFAMATLVSQPWRPPIEVL